MDSAKRAATEQVSTIKVPIWGEEDINQLHHFCAIHLTHRLIKQLGLDKFKMYEADYTS